MQSNWCIKQRSQQFSHWYIKQCLHYWSFFSSLFTTIRTQTIKICFDYYSFNQSSGLFLKSNNPINSFVCNPNWDELISQRKPQQMVQTQTKNQQPSDLLSWICQTIQGPKITSYECVGVLFYWKSYCHMLIYDSLKTITISLEHDSFQRLVSFPKRYLVEDTNLE